MLIHQPRLWKTLKMMTIPLQIRKIKKIKRSPKINLWKALKLTRMMTSKTQKRVVARMTQVKPSRVKVRVSELRSLSSYFLRQGKYTKLIYTQYHNFIHTLIK